MFSKFPRDFSRFVSIFCCKAVPGVAGTVLAGVLSDKELKGRGLLQFELCLCIFNGL